MVIADLPFCDAMPADHEELGYVDMNHQQHRVLFKGIQEGKWLKPGGFLVTSLSTLGGPEDVRRFEHMAWGAGLAIVQKSTFFEDGYGWSVYVLARGEQKEGQLSQEPQYRSGFDWREASAVRMESEGAK